MLSASLNKTFPSFQISNLRGGIKNIYLLSPEKHILIHTHTYIYTHTHTPKPHTHTYIDTQTQTQTLTHILYTHTILYTHKHACTWFHISVCMHASFYVHMITILYLYKSYDCYEYLMIITIVRSHVQKPLSSWQQYIFHTFIDCIII